MKRKVFILKDGCVDDGDAIYTSLKIPCADGAGGALMLLRSGTQTLLELNCVSDGPRSWFIGNSVESDGRLFVATPYDPLYTVLFYLHKSGCVAQTLDQLLCDEQFPDSIRLLDCVALDRLALIADTRAVDADVCAYVYNEAHTLGWLEGRVMAVAACLQTQAALASSLPARNTQPPDTLYVSEACAILARYLPEAIVLRLGERLHIEQPSVGLPPVGKKARLTPATSPDEDYSGVSTATAMNQRVLTTKEKNLAKSAAGTKSILSFFSKKS